MGNDQRADSRTILDQVFWAGVIPPSQADVQPPAKDAPHEPVAVLSAQASVPPVEPERVLDTNNGIQPETIAGEDAAPVEISAAADPHEPKADIREPEPAQEFPTVSSPSVQPILIDAEVAHREFRNMLQGATVGEEALPANFSATADRDEPKADVSEPEPAQEFPTVSSPSVQPILIDAEVAHQEFGNMLQEATVGEEAPPADFSAAADRDEPKAEASEPEPAQEIPSLSSPPVQPILIENADLAHHQFQIEPQEAALADAWIRCVATSTRSSSTAARRRHHQEHAAVTRPLEATKYLE
jgi:hypothetical protein